MESTHTAYTPPFDQLLTYGAGEDSRPEHWPNYQQLGLGPEHVPDLIRMACDKELNWANSDSLEVWAPIHAWRTLGQLRAETAIEPLIALLESFDGENDWAYDELPEVLGMIGPAAFPPLRTRLADITYDDKLRSGVITSIEKIGTRWPEARATCVETLLEQLKRFQENDPEVNGYLALSLAKLHAREALPIVKRAYAAGCVDSTLMGDWEDAQVEFGLLSSEEVQQSQTWHISKPPTRSPLRETILPQISLRESHQQIAAQKKTRNKIAKQSRKKNRKR